MRPIDVSFHQKNYGFGPNDLNQVKPKNLKFNIIFRLIAEKWEHEGLNKNWKMVNNFGIPKEKAINHIQAILNTKHFLTKSQRITFAAALLDQWFKEIEGWNIK